MAWSRSGIVLSFVHFPKNLCCTMGLNPELNFVKTCFLKYLSKIIHDASCGVSDFAKNWITVQCNSRVLIGLAACIIHERLC